MRKPRRSGRTEGHDAGTDKHLNVTAQFLRVKQLWSGFYISSSGRRTWLPPPSGSNLARGGTSRLCLPHSLPTVKRTTTGGSGRERFSKTTRADSGNVASLATERRRRRKNLEECERKRRRSKASLREQKYQLKCASPREDLRANLGDVNERNSCRH